MLYKERIVRNMCNIEPISHKTLVTQNLGIKQIWRLRPEVTYWRKAGMALTIYGDRGCDMECFTEDLYVT